MSLYWSQPEHPATAIPTDIVDVVFALECRQLPVDHAYPLSTALVGVCPWMADEPGLAIHAIHVAASQNGWERPAPGPDSRLQVSRRTKLTVRTPRRRVAALLAALPGVHIQVHDCPLRLGPGKVRPLSKETTLFARQVAADAHAAADADESAFLAATAATLADLGIRMRKALCGRTVPLTTPQGTILTRSLLLADLTSAEAIRLQQLGLGPHRLMGCGIFIPHKGIEAVADAGRTN